MAGTPTRNTAPYPASFHQNNASNIHWNHQGQQGNKLPTNMINNFHNSASNNHNFSQIPQHLSMPPPSLNYNNGPNQRLMGTPAIYHASTNTNNMHDGQSANRPASAQRPPPQFDGNRPPPPFLPPPTQFNFPHTQQRFQSDNHRTFHLQSQSSFAASQSSFPAPPSPFTVSQPPPGMLPPQPNNQMMNYQSFHNSDNQQSIEKRTPQDVLYHDGKVFNSSEQQGVEEAEKKKGEQRLTAWLQKARKSKIHNEKIKVKAKSIKMNNYFYQLKTFMNTIGDMTCQMEKLEAMTSEADKLSWQRECDSMETLKAKYKSLQDVTEKEKVDQVKKKLAGIKQKRSRLKRSRHQRYNANLEMEEARQVKGKQISDWQHGILMEMKEELLKKKRKMEMDQTLSEVTKKINDANRLIETMTSLEKLRLIRQDAAKKRGDAELGESRQSFEQKIADMTRLVQSQLEVYKEEEQQLRKALKSEQEESSKKEKQLQEQKVQEEQKNKDEDLHKMLFGDTADASMSDPLFHYQQFYRQAETSLPAFVQIRHDWDQCIVPADDPDGSTIPLQWVHPCDPTSNTWGSALI